MVVGLASVAGVPHAYRQSREGAVRRGLALDAGPPTAQKRRRTVRVDDTLVAVPLIAMRRRGRAISIDRTLLALSPDAGLAPGSIAVPVPGACKGAAATTTEPLAGIGPAAGKIAAAGAASRMQTRWERIGRAIVAPHAAVAPVVPAKRSRIGAVRVFGALRAETVFTAVWEGSGALGVGLTLDTSPVRRAVRTPLCTGAIGLAETFDAVLARIAQDLGVARAIRIGVAVFAVVVDAHAA